MAYIGNTNTTQGFIPAVDYFNGDGATVAFTLSRPVASVAQVQAVIENVPQAPGDAYTVSGNTLTFTSAPPLGTGNIYVYYTSPITQVATLSQDPVITGSMTFGTIGARIKGDFNNATLSNRVLFQNITTNDNTIVGAIPNGTANISGFVAYSSQDPANSSTFDALVRTDASNAVQLRANKQGTGSYLPMTFTTGGSERMRVDTSGNVGIGTSSPICPLTIISSSSIAAGNPSVVLQGESNRERIAILSAGAGTGTSVFLTASARGTIASPTAILSGDALGYYQFGGYDGSAYIRSAWVQGIAAENYSATNRGSHLTFNTTPTGSTAIAERMRIDSSGNVLVGTTSSDSAVRMNVERIPGAGNQMNIGFTASGTLKWRIGNVATDAFAVYNAANTGMYMSYGATSWTATSDERLKNITGNIENALDSVQTLRAVKFTWNADEEEKPQVGLIAQDVQAVLPEAISEDAEGYLGVRYTETIPLLVAAIQEQQAIIEDLKARIETLEAK